ncbi:transglutaminase domain-containing protein [Flavobacterium terrisoli]|uniref:transglutaminase domain-containing protein n=1 Tax=Flavobacterium terrisoli TaxID=3242195 RepID=UPI0025430AAF|nr:transglutaminase domain-containing protein [Flavobacterium buctense]
MKNSLILFLLFLGQLSFGQVANEYLTIDKKTAQIPASSATTTAEIASYIDSNFKTETEKIRAVFYWTTNNIAYDVPNMFEPNQLDSPQEKIDKTLKSKQGVCIHYAEVFKDIANKLNIKTIIISGYTKQLGQVAPISHAWCASKIDGSWFLFDPTWGAGYVEKQKFVKKMNNAHFKVEPKKMINTHMPFDYLWQFLNSPWTNQEFYDGKEAVGKAKNNFDYLAEIEKYDKLSDGEKAFQAAARVEKNGFKNPLILQYHTYLKNQFTALTQNKNIEKLNDVVAEYNEAVSYLNDFIFYKQRNFKPAISDEELKNMMKTIKEKFKKCNDDVYKVGSVGSQNSAMVSGLKRNISQSLLEVEKQEAFLNDYLSRNKIGRKLMLSNQR